MNKNVGGKISNTQTLGTGGFSKDSLGFTPPTSE